LEVRGFARRDAEHLERIVVRMTKHEIESESWWVRLGRAMGPGLYAVSVIAGMPPRRAAMLAAYGSGDRLAHRGRPAPSKRQQAQHRRPQPEGAAR
jgi:hypothetical protein